MKNAMKKLMSLVLVAMILVSALPFAASADSFDVCIHVNEEAVAQPVVDSISYAELVEWAGIDTDEYDITGYQCWGGAEVAQGSTESVAIEGVVYVYFWTEKKSEPTPPTPTPEPTPEPTPDPEPTVFALSVDVNGEQKVLTSGTSASYEDCLAAAGVDTTSSTVTKALYQYTTEAGVTNVDFGPGDVINMIADTRVYIWAEPKAAAPENNNRPNWPQWPQRPENRPDVNKPDLDGSNDKGYYKLSGDVVLEICIDQNQKPAKTISIKDGIAADGRVNLPEVKSVVKYYYNAIDADTGIVYDGLYKGQTYADNVIEWVKDTKYETVSGLYEAANNCKVVTIRVYISNAKLASTSSSSSNADSTNPKTGDMIMAPMAVMTISASVLAVAFYLNKKRAF